jgi:multisubunit Na+/H+ antiporter MnhB subunit
MNTLLVLSFEQMLVLMLYLFAALLAAIYFPYVWVRAITACSFAIAGAALRPDLAIPAGLITATGFLLYSIIKRAYTSNRKRFFVFVGLGILVGVLVYFFH